MGSSTGTTGDQEQVRGSWMFSAAGDGDGGGGGYSSSMQCQPYYVQSPISSSSADVKAAASSCLNYNLLLSPTRSDVDTTLSRYSSSHGSSTNLLCVNKSTSGVNKLVIVDDGIGFGKGDGDEDEDEDEDEEYYYAKIISWRSYCSFRRSSSCAWIGVQLCWRLLVSLGVALLVFYVATKPPPPKFSIQVAGISEFGLAEGVDSTGVTTKILTCNCSLNLLIENKSKLFGLHIHPPTIELSFGRLPIAMSRGSKFFADNYDSTAFRLYVGTRNKPMYGAGRNMQDLMESGKGLPIEVRVKLSSYFRVVSNIIHPKFHHMAECMLLLGKTYDKKHQTQTFQSYCIVS